MALKRSTIGRVKIATVILPVTDITADNNVDIAVAQHSGLPMPTNAMVNGVDAPMIRATMPLDIALDTFGLSVNEYDTTDTVEAYFANMIGSSIDTNSTHTKYAMTASNFASIYIDSISVSEGSEALAEIVIQFYSADGDASPITGSAANTFPALSAVPENHGIGVFTLNTTAIPGVTGYSYSSGLSLSVQRVDGGAYPTGAIPSSFDPKISIQHADPVELESVLSQIGVTIASTTTITFLKFTNNILSATGEKTFTIAAGYVAPSSQTAGHGGLLTGGCEITCISSDGTTFPIAIS